MKENIIFLGLGAENFALICWLLSHGETMPITIWDSQNASGLGERYKTLKKYRNIVWKFSKRLPSLESYALVVRSSGVFISAPERKRLADSLSNAIELFLRFAATKNIIGVTGTKGKGTTSSLIAHILKTAKKKVYIGANIGIPLFSFIDKLDKDSWVVLELSSFQLQDMKTSPHIAVITNFSPEHLAPADPINPNFHTSLKEYWEAKYNITRFQKKNDYLVINKKLKAKKSKAKVITFTSSTLASTLPGEHNKENIAAAIEVAHLVKISKPIIARAVKKFHGLPYRIEKTTIKNGVSYFNDSFSTTPIATETALRSFTQPIILLAGGADKGSDFKTLARLIKQRVSYIILFKGKGTLRLLQSLKKTGFDKKNITVVDNMKKAITIAGQKSKPGDIVLLSPACASFGLFKNYKDRGNQFNQLLLR